MQISKKLATALMKSWPSFPLERGEALWSLQEIFDHATYLGASDSEKHEIQMRSSASKYQSELDYPWDHYFGMNLKPLLRGKVVLDLGCLNGGRGTAWAERYELEHLFGIDVLDVYIESAKRFAQSKGISADFRIAKGESIPLESEAVDAVLTFDVFEHVQDPRIVLNECQRVLKPGGMAFIVFPSYFQPIEHHLSLATKMPGLQYLFSGKTLVRAYYDVLQARGADATWYKREIPTLKPWEKGNTINGLTLRRFRKLLKDGGWQVVRQVRRPFGSIGRSKRLRLARKLLTPLIYPLTFIPGIQEAALHRVTFIVRKPDNAGT